MKKLILTESQMKTLITKVSNKNTLNEGVENSYNREVDVDLYHNNLTFKGKEIDDISAVGDMDLTFLIEMEGRQWGIKGISVYGIKGDDELELEIRYFDNPEIDSTDTEYEVIYVPINWDLLEEDYQTGEGVVTIGDTLQITLKNDENGNIVIDHMNIDVYSL